MTADIATPDASATTDAAPEPDDGRMSCYRHPDRETWVRCGRCDRPICTRCAMQGPVGMRCRDCGKPVRDAMTSLTPKQIVLSGGLALGGGAIAGGIGVGFGIFGIIVGYFAGTLLAQAIEHVTGYKRGPVMNTLVIGGLIIGAILGAGYAAYDSWQQYLSFGDDIPAEFRMTFIDVLKDTAGSAIVLVGAMIVGAYSRLRY